MAAQTLVEGGRRVLMLDVGHRDPRGYESLVPDRPFQEIRRSDPRQHRYFLGDDLEGVPLGRLRAGSTITTPRRYVLDLVRELTPSLDDELQKVESLAYGGLGAAWGLLCFTYSPAELVAAGLDPAEMAAAYRRVAARVGLAGERDDAAPYTLGPIDAPLPALELDEAARATLAAYRSRRGALNARHLFVGKPLLALLTQDLDGRRATRYHDMDYWSGHGASAYRPAVTIDRLRRHERFEHRDGALVTSFARAGAGVSVRFLDLRTRQPDEVAAGSLVLAAGALGTARIVLRSVYPDPDARPPVPVLSDPYAYVLCARLGLFGRNVRDARHSVTQLVMAYDPHGDGGHVPVAAFTSYRTMLLFRLVKETPLARADARALLQWMQTGLMVVGIHHPNGPAPERRSLALVRHDTGPTGDALRARFSLDADEERRVEADRRTMLWGLRRLGAIPLRIADLGYGSSIHYAGTLPFGEPGRHGTAADGRLNGWDSVWIADASPIRSLPAKGPTLTLMARADAVARRALATSA
jgi:choline dehydrogenase-like flavoprotein